MDLSKKTLRHYYLLQLIFITSVVHSTKFHILSPDDYHTIARRSAEISSDESFQVINMTFPCSGNRTAALENGDLEQVIIKASAENRIPSDVSLPTHTLQLY